MDGRPNSKGNLRYLGHRNGKPVLQESGKGLPLWRSQLRAAIAAAGITVKWPQHAPVVCKMVFTFERPASHFGVNGLKKAGRAMPAPTAKTGHGDIEKLVRAVHDELPMLHDDSQVVMIVARKLWGEREGVRIELYDACAVCGGAVGAPGEYHLCIVRG